PCGQGSRQGCPRSFLKAGAVFADRKVAFGRSSPRPGNRVLIGQLKIPGARAAQPHHERKPALSALGCGLFFVFGMGLMAALQNLAVTSQANGSSGGAPATTALRSEAQSEVFHTPGGDFEYIRVPLEEPKSFLPDTSRPLQAPCWVFEDYTTAALSNLIQACDFTTEQRKSLLDPKRWQCGEDAITLSPAPEVVLDMSRSAREKFYSVLSVSEANLP